MHTGKQSKLCQLYTDPIFVVWEIQCFCDHTYQAWHDSVLDVLKLITTFLCLSRRCLKLVNK